MNIIVVVLALVVIGALVEAMKTYIAIDPLFLLVIRLVLLVAVVYIVLALFNVPSFSLPHAR